MSNSNNTSNISSNICSYCKEPVYYLFEINCNTISHIKSCESNACYKQAVDNIKKYMRQNGLINLDYSIPGSNHKVMDYLTYLYDHNKIYAYDGKYNLKYKYDDYAFYHSIDRSAYYSDDNLSAIKSSLSSIEQQQKLTDDQIKFRSKFNMSPYYVVQIFAIDYSNNQWMIPMIISYDQSKQLQQKEI
jgi:hypothetical protein